MLNLSIPGFGPEVLALAAIPEGALVTAGASGAVGSGLSGISFLAAPAAASASSILSGAATGLGALNSGVGAIGGLKQMSEKQQSASPLPSQKSPTEIPDPESTAVKIKAKRDAALISQKYGRQSTFLTDSDETRLG